MDRFFFISRKLLLILAPICLVLPIVFAEDSIRMGEDYYGNDIDAAISEAKQNNRKVNYSNRYWYNRTTSKSFDLPKLGSKELEKERLEGALQPTAAGKINTTNTVPDEDQTLVVQKNLELNEQENQTGNIEAAPIEVAPRNIYISPDISHVFSRGDKVSTSGIINTGTVTSTPRP